MPLQSTITHIRLDNISRALSTAVATFEVVADSFKSPFLQPILNTIQSLLTAVQTMKKNKAECTQMLEEINKILYAIIHLHINSDTGGKLSPSMLDNLGKFTETLHKVHSFVQAQQNTRRIQQFFRQGELSKLLKECHTGLDQAIEAFKIQGITILNDMADLQHYAQKIHQEVLNLISTWSDHDSDGLSSEGKSVRSGVFQNSQYSSNSLSMLPSEPQIFHGRGSEVSDIIQIFSQGTPRIAILGAAGMGKTTLARAILHHPTITTRYDQNRVFVKCDTVSTSLAGLIGGHVGLKPGKDLTVSVVQYFMNNPPSLLILDNLETVWEPIESRKKVEELLSLLTSVDHLALIITMRGAERPSNVKWTRPFLQPLKPLVLDAAHKIFIDIVDDRYTQEEIDKILLLTDNLPLAVHLMAHLVDDEGLSSVLSRWEIEKTSLLSERHDKGSNLNLSVSLSLRSPRLELLPQAHDLLNLLSILPDGLSDVELLQSKLPIDNILGCKAALLRISLAYTDDQKHLRALAPIREYMQKMQPPTTQIFQPLLKHFNKLLNIHETYHGTVSDAEIVPRIMSNFANIQNVLSIGLHNHDPDLVYTIYSICDLNSFSCFTGHGAIPLMDYIPSIILQPNDPRLQVYFIIKLIQGHRYDIIPDVDHLLLQALELFKYFDDPDLKCNFYHTISEYYFSHKNYISRATEFAQTGLSLSIAAGILKFQSDFRTALAWIQWQNSNYCAGQRYAYESQKLAKMSGSLSKEAQALRIESMCWTYLGNYGHSISICTTARNLLSLCGMAGTDLDHAIRIDMADVHRAKIEYKEALNIQKQILCKSSVDKNSFKHAYTLLNIAQIEVEISASRHDVQRNIDKATSLFKAPRERMYCDIIKAALDLREGQLFAAKTLFQESLLLAWDTSSESVTYCLEKLGDVQQWGSVDQISSAWAVTFLAHSLKTRQKRGIHQALQFLGDVSLANGDENTAVSLFTVALDGFTQLDVHRSKAECMLWLGDISKLDGNFQKAVELWKAARALFEQSSQAKQVTYVDEKLAGIHVQLLKEHSERQVHVSDLQVHMNLAIESTGLGLMSQGTENVIGDV